MGNNWDLSDFDCEMIVGTWCFEHLLIYVDSHSQQSLEFAENGMKKKTSNEEQLCGNKHVGNERGQKSRVRLSKLTGT